MGVSAADLPPPAQRWPWTEAHRKGTPAAPRGVSGNVVLPTR